VRAAAEIAAIALAEQGDLDSALAAFNVAIERFPRHVSLFNNRHAIAFTSNIFRAQLLRRKGLRTEALQDLDMAISLAHSSEVSSSTLAVRQALCQRGILLKISGDYDLARESFQEAANLGSHFAAKEVIHGHVALKLVGS
jgi:tetratricopeptide (TPR) repeat protein